MRDFGELNYVKPVLAQARSIIRHIRSNSVLASKLEELQRPEQPIPLICPPGSRHCASMGMCERLMALKGVLGTLVALPVWDAARAQTRADRQTRFDAVKEVLEFDAFWDLLQLIIAGMAPISELLKQADRDQPNIGTAYAAVQQLRESIVEKKLKLCEDPGVAEERRSQVAAIFDERIGFVNQPVYRAAYALNPKYRTERISAEILLDVDAVVVQCMGAEQGQKAMEVFRNDYITGRSITASMEKAANVVQSAEWWSVFGEGLQPLANFAMRLLSQCPSATPCGNDLSQPQHNFVLNEQRNRLGQKRARDLVNVFQNFGATKRAKTYQMGRCLESTHCEEDESAFSDAD